MIVRFERIYQSAKETLQFKNEKRKRVQVSSYGITFACCSYAVTTTTYYVSPTIRYPVLPPAASRINPAISSGWDTGDAWLELTEMVVAFIR
ncbi:MAG TPA: hypothetical protein VKA91_00145, partial [Nitrososphaeraceae archaeon]|nr:hypothetical protein [Nitrososphaeraceae archaeon]